MDGLKEYIERRIKHANARYESVKEYHGDEPANHFTYYAGQELGFWQGSINAYLNILEKIEEIGSVVKH